MARRSTKVAAGRADSVADTGLARAARYLQPGAASPDGRELDRRGGRQAEELYRERWHHDKIVRSTHGVNCTGSCSWPGLVDVAAVRRPPQSPARTAERTGHLWPTLAADRCRVLTRRGRGLLQGRRHCRPVPSAGRWPTSTRGISPG